MKHTMHIKPITTRIFRENESLLKFVISHFKILPEKAVVVVTSKIVALADGRTVPYIERGDPAFGDLVRKESEWAMQTKYTWLSLKDGTVMASAGIDRSNAAGKMVLLPRNSFDAARRLLKELKRVYKRKKLGVLITDSRLLPLRAGVVGVALGYAGFKGVRDYRGQKDIFGRTLHFSRTDIADSLATAAVLTMGEGNEQQPLAIITQAPVEFVLRNPSQSELCINPHEDIYQPFFAKINTWKNV
jgi:F420-0:gamma-glutamyl ligase